MTRRQDVEALAADAYRRGADPLQLAEVFIRLLTREATGLDPDDPASVRLARRILGVLLEAGWTMPGAITDDRGQLARGSTTN